MIDTEGLAPQGRICILAILRKQGLKILGYFQVERYKLNNDYKIRKLAELNSN